MKLLCGISDGRGRICGRRLGPGTWERWVGVRNAADIVLGTVRDSEYRPSADEVYDFLKQVG